MSEPKRYWISDHGMAESECGAWVHYDDWLKLEEARFALEFRLELATKRNAELHALHETVVRELENVRTVKDSMIRIAKDLGEQCETLRALLDEAPHTIGCSIHMKQRNGYSKDGECDCWKSRIPRAGG